MTKQARQAKITGDDLEQAFGDGYFDLPEYQRFIMLTRRLLGQHVEKVSKEDARRLDESKDIHHPAKPGD